MERPFTLTHRETEVLDLIWDGEQNRDISTRMKISMKTVEAHRANMMKKLIAYESGIAQPCNC